MSKLSDEVRWKGKEIDELDIVELRAFVRSLVDEMETHVKSRTMAATERASKLEEENRKLWRIATK